MDRRVHRLGGILLLLAGFAGLIGGVLDPAQPGPFAEFAAFVAQWKVSVFAIGLAGGLLVLSTLFLVRHFAGAVGEAWTLFGTATLFIGGLALVTVAAWETEVLTAFLSRAGSGSHGSFIAALLGRPAVMNPLTIATSVLLPTSIAAYGAGMLKSSIWPSWLGWVGLVIGVGCLAVRIFPIPLGPVPALPAILVYEWFAVVGFFFMNKRRMDGEAPTPVLERALEETAKGQDLPEQVPMGNAIETILKVAPGLDPAYARGLALGELDPEEVFAGWEWQPAAAPSSNALVAQSSSIEEVSYLEDYHGVGEPRYASSAEPLDPVVAPAEPVWFEYAPEDESQESTLSSEHHTPEFTGHPPYVEAESQAFRDWLSGPH